MKRIFQFLVVAALAAPALAQGQDAAVEERLNRLSAQIQDLSEARDAQNRKLDELARQVRELQEKAGRPDTTAASNDDLKQLAANIKEVDRKRQEDNEKIVRELKDLSRSLGSGSTRKPVAVAPTAPAADAKVPDNGYEYVIKSGDTLSLISKAYTDKGVKVSVEDILKANPGLKPDRMRVGQKIFIPGSAPQ
ncbi:MAG: LysM peptidoglycan-binding domain-containing protein [Verrucomicrobiota bacterium]